MPRLNQVLRALPFGLLLIGLYLQHAKGQEDHAALPGRGNTVGKIAAELMASSASDYGEPLPAEPVGTWLAGILPRDTELAYELNDCGEQTGIPEIDHSREMPSCLAVEAEILSRARRMVLLFDEETLEFRGGSILGEALQGTAPIVSLDELGVTLKTRFAPVPLACKNGTTLRIRDEYAGRYEWCEDATGRKQGPYRSWFNTGLYLMRRGQYTDDVETGEWIACNRFERCVLISYD